MPNRITLHHVAVPLIEPYRISSGAIDSKESILIFIKMEGLFGCGEASPITGDIYSLETPDSTFEFLVETAVPALVRDLTFTPGFVEKSLAEGADNHFAWAGLEGALWGIQAGRENQSISEALGLESKGVESGLAIGIHPTIEELIEDCSKYLGDGYKRLKIKIGPGWDVEPVRAVREAFGDLPLMVDANAAYTEDDLDVFHTIDGYGLMMIEQPLAREDLVGHANIQKELKTPVCFDESAVDLETVREGMRLGACRIINLKIQRIGGLRAGPENV